MYSMFVIEYGTGEMLVSMSACTTLEEFYPAAAISTLMRIIRDPSLSQHHTMVVQAITFIFKSLGLKCVPYLAQVMPAYLHVIKTSDTTFREVSHLCVPWHLTSDPLSLPRSCQHTCLLLKPQTPHLERWVTFATPGTWPLTPVPCPGHASIPACY